MRELVAFEAVNGLILAFQTLVLCAVAEEAVLFGWERLFYFPRWEDVIFGGFYLLIAVFAPATIRTMVLFAREEPWRE
jgi:hypothetical protein